jgi:hypothetical protein
MRGRAGKAESLTSSPRERKLIIVGRTERTLAQSANELGHGTVYYVLDTGNISAIPPSTQKVI